MRKIETKAKFSKADKFHKHHKIQSNIPNQPLALHSSNLSSPPIPPAVGPLAVTQELRLSARYGQQEAWSHPRPSPAS